MPESVKVFNLEERTAVFAESIITFCRTLKIDAVNQRIISQVIGAAGSIGANYGEATEAESKKDFIHKVTIAKKEIKEVVHWLRLLVAAHPERKEEIAPFRKEAHELLLIFAKIVRSSKLNRVIENSIL
ncbi:MAG: four helix bundle protein [bacterium]|nr:four helix bundle protein [bacterium]